MCSCDQLSLQFTVHPSRVYPFSNGIASWSSTYDGFGHMRPRSNLPIVFITGNADGIVSLFFSFVFR